MKLLKFIIYVWLIIILLSITNKIFSQPTTPFIYDEKTGKYYTTDEVITNYLLDLNELEYLDSMLIEKKRQIADANLMIVKQDSILKVKQLSLNDCNYSNAFKDTLIRKLLEPVQIAIPENNPFILFDGFYPNVYTEYSFSRDDLYKPVVSVLKYGLTAEFVFKILNKLKLAIEPIFPFNENLKIQLKVGYKIF